MLFSQSIKELSYKKLPYLYNGGSTERLRMDFIIQRSKAIDLHEFFRLIMATVNLHLYKHLLGVEGRFSSKDNDRNKEIVGITIRLKDGREIEIGDREPTEGYQRPIPPRPPVDTEGKRC